MIEHFVNWTDERGKRRGSLHVRADGAIEIETADERYGTTINPDSARDVASAIFTALVGETCPLCGKPPALSPRPPDAPPELRYTAVLYIRGESELAVVPVVVPVEPCGPGLWKHWNSDGWRIVNDGMVWETQEAAVDAELGRIEEERARLRSKVGPNMEKPQGDYEPLVMENIATLTPEEAKAVRPGYDAWAARRKEFFDMCFASQIDRSVAERAWEESEARRTKGPMATAAGRRPSNFDVLNMEEQWAIDKGLGILDWDGNPEK